MKNKVIKDMLYAMDNRFHGFWQHGESKINSSKIV